MPTHPIDSRLIPLAQIEPNPDQPRKFIDPVAQEGLKASIERQGLLNAISVQELAPGRYRLIAGERRYSAAKDLGWDTIDTRIWPSTLSQQEADLLSLVENLQRKDLNALEIAQGYYALTQAPFNLTNEKIAEQLGIADRSTVTRYLGLLGLPNEIQDMVSRDTISEGHCRYIKRIVDKSTQIEFAQKVEKEGWSVKETEKQVNKLLGKRDMKAKKRKGGASMPDPLAPIWIKANEDPAVSGILWESLYGPLKNMSKGKQAIKGWTFQVGDIFDQAQAPLADWFLAMGQALKGSAPDTKKDLVSGQDLLTSLGLRHFPQTPQEEKDLEELAAKEGPRGVYTRLYGADSSMSQMAPKTWEEIGANPSEGCREILKGIRLMQGSGDGLRP